MARRSPSSPSPRSTCPIACALDLVGDRWTLLVLRDLFLGLNRFGEFLEAGEGIPTNILAERLARLEAARLIESKPYQNNPRRYAYALTEKGADLAPVLGELARWGTRHVRHTKMNDAVRAAVSAGMNRRR